MSTDTREREDVEAEEGEIADAINVLQRFQRHRLLREYGENGHVLPDNIVVSRAISTLLSDRAALKSHIAAQQRDMQQMARDFNVLAAEERAEKAERELGEAHAMLTNEHKISTHDGSGDEANLEDRITWFGVKFYLEAKDLENRARLAEAQAEELRAVLLGPDGDCDLNISAVGWLRSLLDTCRDPLVLNAIHRTSDDPDAINTMLHECEMLERKARQALSALPKTGQEDRTKDGV